MRLENLPFIAGADRYEFAPSCTDDDPDILSSLTCADVVNYFVGYVDCWATCLTAMFQKGLKLYE